MEVYPPAYPDFTNGRYRPIWGIFTHKILFHLISIAYENCTPADGAKCLKFVPTDLRSQMHFKLLLFLDKLEYVKNRHGICSERRVRFGNAFVNPDTGLQKPHPTREQPVRYGRQQNDPHRGTGREHSQGAGGFCVGEGIRSVESQQSEGRIADPAGKQD